MDFMHSFEKQLREYRMLYPHLGSSESLLDILKKQRLILQGEDANVHKYVPKVLTECVDRLRELLQNNLQIPAKKKDPISEDCLLPEIEKE